MAIHVVSGKYQNGHLFFEITLEDGVKHGPFRIYHENGEIMMESIWQYGRLEGVTTFRDTYGNIEQEAHFAAGNLIANVSTRPI